MPACAQNFNTTKHAYEIMLENNSVVEVLPEDADIPRMHYNVRAPWHASCMAPRALSALP